MLQFDNRDFCWILGGFGKIDIRIQLRSLSPQRQGYRTIMEKAFYEHRLTVSVRGFFTLLRNMAVVEEYIAPPPMTEGMFPCSNCHATMEVNRKKTGA